VNKGENHASGAKTQNDTAKIKDETLSSVAQNINPAQCSCGCGSLKMKITNSHMVK
jgi:hypothetical protein